MNSKIVLATIALFCLIQGNNSQVASTADVISDLNARIVVIKTSVGGIIQDGVKFIGEARATASRLVSQAENNVQNQLDQLGNIVAEAEAEAAQKFVDVSSCIAALNEALSLLDLGVFGSCSSTDQLDLLKVKLENLGTVKRKLSSSVNTCSLENVLNSEGLRACVQGDIDNAQKQAASIQDEVKRVCEEAKKNASACVAAVLLKVDRTIDDVAHDLKRCLQSIL